MMDVRPFFWWVSTVFQTLLTQGQVVSTTSTFYTMVRYETMDLKAGAPEYEKTHLFVKHIHFFKRSSKCRQNDDITFSNRVEIFLAFSNLFDKFDIHVGQIIIDFWIVN
jgi:hypothetical protein